MKYENKMGRRFIAFVIDILVLQIFSSILINLGLGIEYNYFGISVIELTYWQQLILYLVYFVGFAIFTKGATIGKMVLGLKVLQTDYKQITDSKLIIREVVKALLMPVSFVSFIVAAFHEENKSIHDLILDSIVVKEINYIENPNNPSVPLKQVYKPNRLKGFNEPNDEDFYDDPADKEYIQEKQKEYIDPLDENYEIDDDKY